MGTLGYSSNEERKASGRREGLTPAECSSMRGVAIVGIMLHNFLHWMPNVTSENEFRFQAANVEAIREALSSHDAMLPAHMISFFGHYGVVVFIFLSAYGLVCKYEKRGTSELTTHAPHHFIVSHAIKLLKMMTVGMVLYTLQGMILGREISLFHVIGQMSMMLNLLPYPGDRMDPGPYWFFGLLLQFYILYRLFLYKSKTSTIIIMIAICTIIQMVCTPEGAWLEYWRYNFIGSMLPFGLGMIAARQSFVLSKKASWCLILPSLILLYGLSLDYSTWFFAPIAAIVGTLSFVGILPHIVRRLLMYVGILSSSIFIIHPIFRRQFAWVAQSGDFWTGFGWYGLTTCLGAIGLYFLFKYILNQSFYKKVISKIKNIRRSFVES